MTNYPALGSISSGTMRPEDIIPAMADVLRDFVKANPGHDSIETAHFTALVEEADAIDGGDMDSPLESVTDVWENLDNALNEIAPPYCYFGSHEGDGSDYGFWPLIGNLEDDVRDGDDVLKVGDMSEVPDGWRGYVMLVSDHGNVTLLEPVTTWREVWAIV